MTQINDLKQMKFMIPDKILGKAIARVYFLMIATHFCALASLSQPSTDYPEFIEATNLFEKRDFGNALIKLDLAINNSEYHNDNRNSILFKLKKSEVYRTIGQYDSAILLLNDLAYLVNKGSTLDLHPKARIYFEFGANYIHKGELKIGKWNICQAISLFEIIDEDVEVSLAQCFSKLGNYYLYNKQYDSTLFFYERAFNLIQKHSKLKDFPNSLINLGIGYFLNGFYQLAERSFLDAIDLILADLYPDNYLLCKAYFNLGLYYYNLSQYDNSLSNFNEAEKLALKYTDKSHIDLGNLAWNKSLLLLGLGDITKAAQYMHEARQIFDKKFAKNNPIISALDMDQALIYEALGLKEEAVKLYRISLINTATPIKLKTYRNLAKLYMNDEELNEAGKYFDSCFLMITDNPNLAPIEIAYTELYYSDYLIKSRDKSAIKHLNNAFELFINIFGIKHRDVARVLSLMGDHYLRQGKIDLALYYYHQSIISITPAFNNAELLANPAREEVSIDQHSILLFEQKALVLTRIYMETKDPEYLESLLGLYDLMIHTIEQFLKLYRTEDGRMLLSEECHGIYKNAVQAYVMAFDHTNKLEYAEKAFELSEKSKSSILLAELKDENAKKLGLVPDKLYQLEKSLRGNLYLYKKNIIEEEKEEDPNEGKLVFMRSKMFQEEKKYDSLINLYENEYPEYYKLKFDPGVISVSDLQDLLEDEEVLIEYTLTNDYLISFVITNSDFFVHKHDLDTLLVSNIFALRNNLNIPMAQYYKIADYQQFQELSHHLNKTLFDPLRDDFPGTKVILIPDGELAYLSFESLTEYPLNPDSINFKDQPYLIHKYTFSYESSATIFSMSLNQKNPSLEKGILSMAPTYPLIDKKFIEEYGDFGGIVNVDRNLPGALEEAELVLTYIQGEKLSGENATEASFKKMASDYDILHFAMHTWIDDSNPLSSRLAFYPFGDTTEDDILHTYEIYNMRLNGHLAVLSACSTGNGLLQKGEGVMSLARAFAFAGMPSVIMTLWDVEDLTTREIIPDLYYLLARGQRKDDALRQAKLNHLKSVNIMIEAHPAFWAGHVLYGNKKPFIQPRPIFPLLALTSLGILLVIISIVLVIKYRKYRKNKPIPLDLSYEFQSKNRV